MRILEGVMHLKKLRMAFFIPVCALALILPAFPEAADEVGQGHAIVTVLPANDTNASVNILRRDLQVKVNGKDAGILTWKPLREDNSDLELVILIDGTATGSIGRQLDDISGFIRSLPPNVKVAVGYMNAGRAVMAGPLSANHAEAVSKLHVPAGVFGSNASPYFCLSDLARKWPSKDRLARREVVLITNGADNYYEGYNSEDPYLKTAIRNSVRAGLVVYSIYWPIRGNNSNSQSFAGQSMLTQVVRATGGYSYWDGTNREPVALRPYLEDIAWRLRNQYQLSFQISLEDKPELQNMNLKVVNQEVEVFAPQRVFVRRLSGEQGEGKMP
jgi:hypothetical protein